MITETEIQQLRSRVIQVEENLKVLYRHLNLQYPETGLDPIMTPQLQAAIHSGNKIEAIKIYRELTGLGLAEAKAAIDKVM
jgi:ribosomal protein L7/L12